MREAPSGDAKVQCLIDQIRRQRLTAFLPFHSALSGDTPPNNLLTHRLSQRQRYSLSADTRGDGSRRCTDLDLHSQSELHSRASQPILPTAAANPVRIPASM
jgi:hypothetical protein